MNIFDMLPSIAFIGLLWWLSGKESACNAGDLDSILGLGRSPEGGHGNPLQYSGEFHGQRSLVVYSPWGHNESDMTKELIVSLHFHVNTSNIYFCLDFSMEFDLRKY